jgi:hypothetical protein
MEQTAEREWVSATITRVAGVTYLRFVIKTRWLTADDRLADVLEAAVGDLTCTGDTVVVSEKAAILLSGRAVPISTIRPGRLARTLARLVRRVAARAVCPYPKRCNTCWIARAVRGSCSRRPPRP